VSKVPDLWNRHLEPGEKLVWSGLPQRSSVTFYLLIDACIFLVAASVLWALGSNRFEGAGHLLFVAVLGAAIYTLLLLLFVTGAHAIAYAITDRRILILRRFGTWWLKSYKIGPETELRRGSAFQGVWFSRQSLIGGFPARFLGIDDDTYLNLENKICQLQEGMT
jgi:hypothetical protein